MTIYSLLKADHRAVKALLVKLTQKSQHGSDEQRQKLLQKIRAELLVHNQAEEAVFYSRLTASIESRVLTIEGKREHELVEELLSELSDLPGTSEEFIGKAKVLRDLVEHHVEEEEGDIHRQARKELSTVEAKEIGSEFAALKKSYAKDKDFFGQPHLGALPKLQPGLLMNRGKSQGARH
jgi:hemerythrin-like domain-containing protein